MTYYNNYYIKKKISSILLSVQEKSMKVVCFGMF